MPILQPHGINNRSQIVGSTNAGAFLWQRGQRTRLPSLVNSSGAQGINDRGQIVGTSASMAGMDARFHAVLWTR